MLKILLKLNFDSKKLYNAVHINLGMCITWQTTKDGTKRIYFFLVISWDVIYEFNLALLINLFYLEIRWPIERKLNRAYWILSLSFLCIFYAMWVTIKETLFTKRYLPLPSESCFSVGGRKYLSKHFDGTCYILYQDGWRQINISENLLSGLNNNETSFTVFVWTEYKNCFSQRERLRFQIP